MKLTLDVKIPLKVQEGGKIKEQLEVYFRDYNKKELKEMESVVSKFKTLFKKVNKIEEQLRTIDKKIELSEKTDNFKKAFGFIEDKEKLLEVVNDIEDELELLGGDGFEEEMAKKRFDLLVSGNDKEKLREYAEIKGYRMIIQVLDKQKAEIEKKQFGE